MNNVYVTIRGTYSAPENNEVYVNDQLLSPKQSQTLLKNQAGFDWGMAGSPATVLALAICLEICKDENVALGVYGHFKREYVSRWPHGKDFKIGPIKINEFLARVTREE